MKNIFVIFTFMLFAVTGCSAIDTQAQFGELKVYVFTDEPIIFTTSPKTLHLNFHAPQDVMSVKSHIENRIVEKGIILVDSPDNADVVLHVVLSNANMETMTAKQAQGNDGSVAAGVVTGGAVGFASKGTLSGTLSGAAIGGIAGGLADLTINNWVTLGELRVRGDILAQERIKTSEYVTHKTRVMVRAQKTNLKWEDCENEVAGKFSEAVVNSL